MVAQLTHRFSSLSCPPPLVFALRPAPGPHPQTLQSSYVTGARGPISVEKTGCPSNDTPLLPMPCFIVDDPQTLQSSYARCTASEEAAGLPMWRWMGDPPPAAAAGGPIEPRGKGRTAEDQPPRGSSSSINTASSSSSSGVEVERQEQEQLLVVVSCPPPVPTRRQGAGGSSRGRGGGGGGGGADLGAGAGGKVHTVKLAVGELELGAGRAGDGKAGGVEGGGSSAAKLVSDPWAWQPGQPGRCVERLLEDLAPP